MADNRGRVLALLIWVAGGVGGILPDVDHIPWMVFQKKMCLPILSEANELLGIATAHCYGRPLHSAFLVTAIISLTS